MQYCIIDGSILTHIGQLLREMNESDQPSAEIGPVSIYEVCYDKKSALLLMIHADSSSIRRSFSCRR